MNGSINKVILIGNLGQDPEVRQLPSGADVVGLSIATSESWKDKQTGEHHEKTEWHRVKAFGQPASFASAYLRKGNKVYIEGSLETRKWQGQDGTDRYTTEIKAFKIENLSPRSLAADEPERMKPDEIPNGGMGDLDDDIPF